MTVERRSSTAFRKTTCETIAAVVLHIRRVGDRPVHLGGHVTPKPFALCGSPVGWDCQSPISAATCVRCIAVEAKETA